MQDKDKNNDSIHKEHIPQQSADPNYNDLHSPDEE